MLPADPSEVRLPFSRAELAPMLLASMVVAAGSAAVVRLLSMP
jgi:hypothetical protein